MQKVVLQPRENPGLDIRPFDRLPVRAGPGIARHRAAKPACADQDIGRATAAAGQRPRQQVARSMTPFDPGCLGAFSALRQDLLPDRALVLLHPGPQGVVDDPQMRHLFGDPLGGRVHPDLPFAAVRILHEALTVPDQPANVELVVLQDPYGAVRRASALPGSAGLRGVYHRRNPAPCLEVSPRPRIKSVDSRRVPRSWRPVTSGRTIRLLGPALRAGGPGRMRPFGIERQVTGTRSAREVSILLPFFTVHWRGTFIWNGGKSLRMNRCQWLTESRPKRW